MSLNSLNQYNETRACDSCRTLNIRCSRDVTRSATKCAQCTGRNQECTYFNPPDDNEIFCGLSSEEIKYFKNMYIREQLRRVVTIFKSTTSQPCPYKNIEGHICHRGCIVRYNNLN
ncbi:hypothetical protein C2G38_2156129 [Gigaspora rosea]|uniref:Zn(2)-C6 fungal-type domain-containing protein n=1 Tax=Gigaspora rosea TaxID=44941 RepID=A0A397W6E6_9GLOM|nr:hypothetical protein C2G38_2156129 [Gigaspora rosea]